MIGTAELALMKPTATLVNTGRGGVVDEGALMTALRRGDLHSAGLDVMTDEPRTDPCDPLLNEPHLVVLPHVGSATEATRAAMVELAARNIEAVLTGHPAPTPLPGTRGVPARPARLGCGAEGVPHNRSAGTTHKAALTWAPCCREPGGFATHQDPDQPRANPRHMRPAAPLTLVKQPCHVYHQQTKNLLAPLRRSAFRIGHERRCRQTAVISESCETSTRRQCERRRPSATPDSTASRVSIGPDATEPANAHTCAEAGKRTSHPSLTRRQQSQHQVSKSPATATHRQPHRGIANRTGLSQPAVWTPSGKQVEGSENGPTAFRPAATNAHAFPQVSAPSPAASRAPVAVPVRAVEPRRTPSPPRTGSLPSSPDGPVRSLPEIARSSSRT